MLENTVRRRFVAVAAMLALLVLGAVQTQGLAQTTRLSNREVKELISKSKTAADHQHLANHYAQEASKLDGQAKEHAELTEAYVKSPSPPESKHPNSGETAGHCKIMAERYSSLAKEAEALSKLHSEMAKAAK